MGGPGRRWLLGGAVVIGAALLGYLATCAIYPAPIVPKDVPVPALRGLPPDSALGLLTELGLRGRITDDMRDPLVPAGTIAWQSPAPETLLPQGTVVRLGTSSGAPGVSVPDVSDFEVDLARTVLAAAGLRVVVTDTVRDDAPYGTVLSMRPAAGSAVRAGETMLLTISRGPATVKVPELVGLPLGQARDRLLAAGLRVGMLQQRFEGLAGTVLAQDPPGGTLVARETAVNLTISGAME